VGTAGGSGLDVRERTLNLLAPVITPDKDELDDIWAALVLGVRDYVTKNGFASVALGLSGGIDSAVCAVIAADAIGADRVFGVSMPSQWSSDHSQSDAADLANRLGCQYDVQPIGDLVGPFEQQLQLKGLAAENIQARARGMILMALSNQHGHLVLTTGNKSEIAVGYSTMYGDTVGGYAPLKDVPKTLVWELAEWRNRAATDKGDPAPIPQNSISKPPSAELRPGQTDQDSLPPYDVLDSILDRLIDRRESISTIVKAGFALELVSHIAHLVSISEWKRRQGAIGPRISRMAFGRERRLPITVRRSTL
jgi:NAD+ synthase (glutamine-hydrolysing)